MRWSSRFRSSSGTWATHSDRVGFPRCMQDMQVVLHRQPANDRRPLQAVGAAACDNARIAANELTMVAGPARVQLMRHEDGST
jgi:hypothetical protein